MRCTYGPTIGAMLEAAMVRIEEERRQRAEFLAEQRRRFEERAAARAARKAGTPQGLAIEDVLTGASYDADEWPSRRVASARRKLLAKGAQRPQG